MQLKQFGKAERYDLTRFALIYFSSSKKKPPKTRCLTLQTNHTDFGYKAYCAFAQFREEFLYWRILAGSSPASTGRTAEKLICFLSSSSASHRGHPERRAPQGKGISLVASKTLALSIPRKRHCERLLRPFEITAALLFIILVFPSFFLATELPSSQVTIQWKRWLFLHPTIKKYYIQDKMAICKTHY